MPSRKRLSSWRARGCWWSRGWSIGAGCCCSTAVGLDFSTGRCKLVGEGRYSPTSPARSCSRTPWLWSAHAWRVRAGSFWWGQNTIRQSLAILTNALEVQIQSLVGLVSNDSALSQRLNSNLDASTITSPCLRAMDKLLVITWSHNRLPRTTQLLLLRPRVLRCVHGQKDP